MFRGIASCGQGAESAFLDGAKVPWTRLTRGESLASFALDTRRRNHTALRKADRAWAPPEARHRLGAVAPRAAGFIPAALGGQVRSGAPSFQRGRVLGLLPDESGPASGAAMSC